MSREKRIEDGIRLSVVLPRKQAEQIRRMATRMSLKEDRQIGVSEAIRMAVEAVYPVPNDQMVLF